MVTERVLEVHFFHAPFEGEVPEPDYKERRGWMTELEGRRAL